MPTLSIGVLVAGMQTTPAAIVDRFIPFAALELEEGQTAGVHGCHVVLETDAAGQPSAIVAAYQANANGQLRVLVRGASGAFELGAESADNLVLSGEGCELEVMDLDGEQPSDIFLRVGRRGGDSAWIFQWDAGVLSHVTPTIDLEALKDSALRFPIVMDIFHDGKKQIFASEEPLGSGGEGGELYEKVDTEWAARTRVRDVWDVVYLGQRMDLHTVRGGGGGGRYTLTLVNGHHGGTGRVTASSIRVNGVEVLPARGLTVADEFLVVDLGVGLAANATVDIVTTAGGADGSLTAVLSEEDRYNVYRNRHAGDRAGGQEAGSH